MKKTPNILKSFLKSPKLNSKKHLSIEDVTWLALLAQCPNDAPKKFPKLINEILMHLEGQALKTALTIFGEITNEKAKQHHIFLKKWVDGLNESKTQ